MENEPQPIDYETADAIIGGVRHVDKMSRATLARWHRAGLISKPKTVSLGCGKGSESRYPPGTLDRVLVILGKRKRRTKLDDLAWDLWWDGYDVSPAATRKTLAKFAAKWDQGLKTNSIEDAFNEIETKRLPDPVGKIRKRVGRKNVRAVAAAILSTVTDRIDESAVDVVDAATFDKAFNLKRARTEHLRGAGPFIQSDQHVILRLMSSLLRGRSMVDALSATTDDDVRAARDGYKRLIGTTGHASRQTGQMYGKGAFGFDVLGSQATPRSRAQQQYVVVAWPLLMASPVLAEGLKTFFDTTVSLNATDQAFEEIQHLRRDVPAVKEIASLRRIGAGLKNKRKQAQLDAAARRIGKKHGAEIQASLDRIRKARAKGGTSQTRDSEEMGNKQRPNESPR